MKRLLLIIVLLSPCLIHAQSFLDLGLRGGLSGMMYDCEYGGNTPGYHVAFDMGYLYKSPYWFTLRVGASIETATSYYRQKGYEDQYTTTDRDGDEMLIQYSLGMLREQHQTYSVSFPIQIGFSIQQFTFLVGPRFTLPLNGLWKESISAGSLSVYFPKYDNLVEDAYPLAASRSFEMDNSGKMTLPQWQCVITGELTYDIAIGSAFREGKSFLCVGAYFDVGLIPAETSPIKEHYGVVYLTDVPVTRILTSVLQAWYNDRPLISKFSNYDVGIKVAYRFTFSQRHKKRRGCNCYVN